MEEVSEEASWARPTVLSGSATKLSCPMGEWAETGTLGPYQL